MSVSLPPLPERSLLADLCREAAARERVEPQLVKKAKVEAGLALDLPAVLRADAPAFDLEAMLARFDQLWRK